jgi:hypothetical protein
LRHSRASPLESPDEKTKLKITLDELTKERYTGIEEIATAGMADKKGEIK